MNRATRTWLSIIVPAYNAGTLLPKLIHSISRQNPGSDVEVICVNDGSTDDTLQVLHTLSLEHKSCRIKVLTQSNQGQNKARLAGLSEATGEYIWFVDADDYISDKSFASLFQAIRAGNNPDCVMFDMERTDLNGTPESNSANHVFPTARLVSGPDMKALEKLIASSRILNNLCTKLIKKHVLKPVYFERSSSLRWGEDWMVCLQILTSIESAYYFPESLYFYRRNPTSVSNSQFSETRVLNYERQYTIAKSYLDQIGKHDLVEILEEGYAGILGYCCGCACISGQFGLLRTISGTQFCSAALHHPRTWDTTLKNKFWLSIIWALRKLGLSVQPKTS